MSVLLVSDIDRTLCDSREADHLLPPRDSTDYDAYKKWHQFTSETNFPTTLFAKEGLANTISIWQPDHILFLTARSESLRDPTTKWLINHFGDIIPANFSLNMRPIEDKTSSFESKSRRMKVVRGENSEIYDQVIFADDEPHGLGLCTGPRDVFIYIRNCDWTQMMIAIPSE